jgi:hypothetical protein
MALSMKKHSLSQLLDLLWKDYIETNPPALRIHDLFTSKGEKVVNDHIALRTFDHPKIDISVLAKVFTELGYRPVGTYYFQVKKLFAQHYEHSDPDMPLIFISQLETGKFDEKTQKIIHSLVDQIPANFTGDPDFICKGRPWPVRHADYEALKEVSEYAAWMAAFGFRANHFTVSINHLKYFESVQEVNMFLKENGFELNEAGGEVKGSPDLYLEQSSTIAYNAEVDFEDGIHKIPACYYEFARRYPLPDGKLFRGFVEGSADKIFESTNKGQDHNN